MGSDDGGGSEADACEYCGADKNQHGTSLDLEIFYLDYKYDGYPSFCSWEHAAAWFNGPIPDFETWDKSSEGPLSFTNRVIAAVLILGFLGFVALAVLGFLDVINA